MVWQDRVGLVNWGVHFGSEGGSGFRVSEEIKSEFKVLLVGRTVATGSSRVVEMLDRLGVGSAVCATVYAAMARLVRDASIGAVIVRIADLGSADHAFFEAVRRLGRPVVVYVDAADAEGEDIERAVSMGAAGVIDADSRGEAVVSGWVGRLVTTNGHANGDGAEEADVAVRVPWKPLSADDRPVRQGPAAVSEDVGSVGNHEKKGEGFLADGETNVMLESDEGRSEAVNVSGVADDGTDALLSQEEIESLIFGSSGMDDELPGIERSSS